MMLRQNKSYLSAIEKNVTLRMLIGKGLIQVNKKQIVEMFKLIKSVYPNFEVDQMKVDAWAKVMRGQDYDRIIIKLKEHKKTNKFPPTIAEITANAPKKNYHLKKKKKWKREAAKVPEETKSQFREKLKQLIMEKEQ